MTAENRRILIVDDERPILLTLEALLGRHGYVTETVSRQQKKAAQLLGIQRPTLFNKMKRYAIEL